MDVGSKPRSRPGRPSAIGPERVSAMIVGTVLVIVMGLALAALLVALSDLLHLAPASESVLSGPFRWSG